MDFRYADCMVVPSANREAAEIGTILTYFSALSHRDKAMDTTIDRMYAKYVN